MDKRKILVTHPKAKSETTKLILEELNKLFHAVNVPLDEIVVCASTSGIEVRTNGKLLHDFDYFFPRIDGKRMLHGYNVVKAFDVLGIKHPYPAETLRIAHDKFLTTTVLGSRGINVPATYALKSAESIEKLTNKLEFPVVVKLVSGSGGKGVMFAHTEEELKAMVSSMESLKQEIVVQEFIPNKGEDIRVLLLGYEVAAAMKRVAAEGEKRANVSSGGKVMAYEPSEDVKELAIRSAEALEARILAVDIIVDGEGTPYVIEVNVNPGIRGLMKATDKNIAKMVAEFVEREIRD